MKTEENSEHSIGISTGNKAKIIVTIIFAVIGLIIGIIIAREQGEWPQELSSWFFVWLFLGIGGNLIIEITERLSAFVGTVNDTRRDGESFFSALGMTLFLTILWIVIKSLAGPIFPIKQIVEWANS